MATVRIPLGADLQSRDGAVTKDAKVMNALVEVGGDQRRVMKRPGLTDLGSVASGNASLLYYYNSQALTIINNAINRSTPSPLSNTSVGGWVWTVTSITRSGSTATVTTGSVASGVVVGDSVTISGCTQPEYNITATVTAVTNTTFSYTVSGTPATPATGSPVAITNSAMRLSAADNGLTSGTTGYVLIHRPGTTYGVFRRVRSDWNYTGGLYGVDYFGYTLTVNGTVLAVPGVEYMDGYFFAMNAAGTIFNNTVNTDPAGVNWSSSNYVTANRQNGAGVALTRSRNYIIALKEWSTEPFYDAGLTPSPLSPVDNGYTDVGCASGWSVAKLDEYVVFVSQVRSKGRGVHMMAGLEQRRISTSAVERILNLDSLSGVYAYGVRLNGHSLYVLTLTNTGITLVYDLTSGVWTQWTSYTAAANVNVSTISSSNGVVTVVTSTAHGLSDGDPCTIAGATVSGYNGMFQISYISSTSFSYDTGNTSLATSTTGSVTVTPYTESYFKLGFYATGASLDLGLHFTDGHLYSISPSTGSDNSLPINVFVRIQKLDGGDDDVKKMGRISLIGDVSAAYPMIRWSDDDCATFAPYRQVYMSDAIPNTRRCGAFRRRTLEIRHANTVTLNPLDALELEVQK